MTKNIIHQLSLVGIGGVQQSFVPYLKMVLKYSSFKHSVYGMYELDENYNDIQKYYTNVNSSIFNKLKFIYFLYSNKYIVHFYNNLGSSSVNKLLKLIPSSNIIFHERGTIWNARDEEKEIYQSNASKAKIILANSHASKIMLIERFGIDEKKIKVIYNGFLSKKEEFIPKVHSRYSQKFSLGYIGRLDTPKGVHIFIESAKNLPQYDFFIAGIGAWENKLKKIAEGYKNIYFVGRVKEPLEFISQMDLIVVPSIREPLGNTIIEAGFCKKAVIASNIDGIPEIIDHNHNGILLEPKKKLSVVELPQNAVPIPQVVVNPDSNLLVKAKEIDVDELIDCIKELAQNEMLRNKYGNNLYDKVINKFTIESYFEKIESIYGEL